MTEADKALTFLDFDDPEGGLIAYSVSKGHMPDDAADEIWRRFDNASAEGKKLIIYCEMRSLPRMDAGIIMEKFKRLGSILSTLDRFAIVGDQGWLDVYSKMVDPITRFEVRSFATDQEAIARAWVQGKA